MSTLSSDFPRSPSARLTMVLGLALGCIIAAAPGLAEDGVQAGQQSMPGDGMANGGMAHMAGHMFMTALRPIKPEDQQKAEAIVAAAKEAMAPYQDYRKALADGYELC